MFRRIVLSFIFFSTNALFGVIEEFRCVTLEDGQEAYLGVVRIDLDSEDFIGSRRTLRGLIQDASLYEIPCILAKVTSSYWPQPPEPSHKGCLSIFKRNKISVYKETTKEIRWYSAHMVNWSFYKRGHPDYTTIDIVKQSRVFYDESGIYSFGDWCYNLMAVCDGTIEYYVVDPKEQKLIFLEDGLYVLGNALYYGNLRFLSYCHENLFRFCSLKGKIARSDPELLRRRSKVAPAGEKIGYPSKEH